MKRNEKKRKEAKGMQGLEWCSLYEHIAQHTYIYRKHKSDTTAKRVQRQSETPQQKEERRQRNLTAKRAQLQSETAQQKEERRLQDLTAKRAKLQSETAQQKGEKAAKPYSKESSASV